MGFASLFGIVYVPNTVNCVKLLLTSARVALLMCDANPICLDVCAKPCSTSSVLVQAVSASVAVASKNILFFMLKCFR